MKIHQINTNHYQSFTFVFFANAIRWQRELQKNCTFIFKCFLLLHFTCYYVFAQSMPIDANGWIYLCWLIKFCLIDMSLSSTHPPSLSLNQFSHLCVTSIQIDNIHRNAVCDLSIQKASDFYFYFTLHLSSSIHCEFFLSFLFVQARW